jgi:hypothetical protein
VNWNRKRRSSLLFAHRIYSKTGVQPRFCGAMLFGPMRYAERRIATGYPSSSCQTEAGLPGMLCPHASAACTIRGKRWCGARRYALWVGAISCRRAAFRAGPWRLALRNILRDPFASGFRLDAQGLSCG